MSDITFSNNALQPLPLGAVTLGPGQALHRRQLTAEYLLSLKPRNMLLHHYFEAARWQYNAQPTDIHWGWESPTSQVRGHFVGHWMSAAAYLWRTTGDARFKGTLDHIVGELALCQRDNGGEWVAPLPEKYLHWIAQGRAIWAPMYICHKTLMGLFDAYQLTGNDQALEVIVNAARWFTRFTDPMSRDELDDLLDWETGGIQEIWADLYSVTGDQAHLDLVERFDRRRLIDRLVAGEDPLTNQHANQTVPEIMSAARAYEVTGDKRWRDAVEAYWRCAVTNRGTFVTGGQTFGEFWTPPFEFAARLGKTNQEHCVVFNMMRLAERLLCWTGEPEYADYLERNRYNGTYAQQHPETGMVAYYLPLAPGSRKEWATPTETFSCCMATMVQAGSRHGTTAYYTDGTDLTIAQYVASTATWEVDDATVRLDVSTFEDQPEPGRANFDHGLPAHKPNAMAIDIAVHASTPVEAALRVRLPEWLAGPPRLTVDGESVDLPFSPGTFQPVRRRWTDNQLSLELPTEVRAVPLPDQPGTVAFLDGPVALAGLVGERRRLRGDADDPASLLEPVGEFELGVWQTRYSTKGQPADFDLIPLNQVTDQTYTVYFPVGE